MNKPIRHLSASNKSLVAAGAFEKDVEVRDIEARVKVSAFSTTLNFGGERLCLDNEGIRCFTAGYGSGALPGYSTDTGEKIWEG